MPYEVHVAPINQSITPSNLMPYEVHVAPINQSITSSNQMPYRVLELINQSIDRPWMETRKLVETSVVDQVLKYFFLFFPEGDELEKSKSVFATREKELAEAVAKVDILTAQLDRNRSSSKPASSVVNNNAGSDTVHTTFIAAEIDRLKQEQRYRSHLVQQQKRKIDSKDASLVQKTLERNQLDVRINEIAERLNKRKVQILTATQPPSNGQKHQGQNAVGAGAVAAGGNANVGGGGGRPPLAQPVGARDPAKVATIEPYNQRLPYENRENSSG